MGGGRGEGETGEGWVDGMGGGGGGGGGGGEKDLGLKEVANKV